MRPHQNRTHTHNMNMNSAAAAAQVRRYYTKKAGGTSLPKTKPASADSASAADDGVLAAKGTSAGGTSADSAVGLDAETSGAAHGRSAGCTDRRSTMVAADFKAAVAKKPEVGRSPLDPPKVPGMPSFKRLSCASLTSM